MSTKGKVRNGISINAILLFPARRENAIISKIIMAFRRLLMKNVCGKNSNMPKMMDNIPRYSTTDALMPKSAIIFA